MKLGRPTKFTEALGTKICALIREGHFVDAVAKSVGVHRDSIYEWVKRGEAKDAPEGDEPFVRFASLYRSAEGDAEIALARALLNPSKNETPASIKAKAWFAQRRWPGRYGNRQVLQHEGPDGGAVQVDVHDARAKLLAKLAERKKPGGKG